MTREKRRTLAGIDLFCGVGGMSLGFESAGFDIAAALDSNPLCVEFHSRNFPGVPAIQADLTRVKGKDILSEIKCRRRIDVVFGGPPCQGFSIGGVRDQADERNELLLHFARVVAQIRPRYFVLENVVGLLEARNEHVLKAFLRRVRAQGYRVVTPLQVLCASDYGVPQRRRRVFILGYQKNETAPRYPAPLKRRKVTVWEAIGDLAVAERYQEGLDEDIFHGRLGEPSGYVRELSQFRRTKGKPTEISGFQRTMHSREMVKRFKRQPPGTRDPISRFFRLEKDGLSPTQRAGTGQDRGSYMAPRPIHPIFPRCICLREAARLHSFPDWFEFHPAKWHGFMQIGNSVPPRLARAVAMEIRRALAGS